MERYESYKDSGVAWIGQVPSHWIHSRIKFCLSRSVAGIWGDDEKGNKDDIVCFRVADFDYSKGCLTFDKLTIRNVSAAQLQNRLLHDEDLLIEKSGGGDATPVGRVVRFNYNDKAICSNFIHSISVKEGYSSNYLYYYFYGMYANKVNLLYFNQTTGIQNLKVGEYLSQTIYLPTLVEQQAIAAYLDKRCCEIDKAIATQQKRIALLQELKQSIITHAVTRGIHPDVPLKESGVEWIGQVPSHWIHFRIKFCLSRSVAGIWGDDEKGNKDDIVCFRVADFDYSKGCLTFDKLTIRNVSAAQLQNRLLHDGDLLIEKSGGGDTTPVGRVVRFTYNDKAICSNFIHSISVKEGYCSNYLYYYFYGMYADKVNLLYFNQTTGIQNLKVGEYLSQKIYLPTLVEQQAIAVYLDGRCSEIDKAIATQQKRISLLQELKQSIITEAITGKIKVC